MADEIVLEQLAVQAQPQGLPQEIRDLMEISLNGGQIPEPKVEISEEGQQAAAEAPVFSFDIFKEQFGYEKPEDVSREITELRALKNAPPPVATEIKFENEQSEKVFKLLQENKIPEVIAFYAEQAQLDKLLSAEINKDTAADIVKMSMQKKYSGLTKDQIDYRFNKSFGVPAEPKKDELEDEDDFKIRHADWKQKAQDAEMELIIEANVLKPDLEAAKIKLVLPNIEQASDPNYQAYLQAQEDAKGKAQVDAETIEAYKSFKPEELEQKVNFKDEPNKIDFDFKFVPDAEGFKKAIESVDPEKFFSSYKNQDGTPNRKKFLEDIYFSQNREKVIREAINQGKNAAIKAMLPDNSSGGMNRLQAQATGEETELDKQMKAAGVVK